MGHMFLLALFWTCIAALCCILYWGAIYQVKEEIRKLQYTNECMRIGEKPSYVMNPVFGGHAIRSLAENRTAVICAYILAPLLVAGGAIMLIAYAFRMIPEAVEDEMYDIRSTLKKQ